MTAAPPFAPARARTLAERALMRCTNPECRALAPDGEAVAIVPPRPGRPGSSLFDAVDNGLWLCPRCAAAVAAARETLPPRVLRAWAAEHTAWLERRLPALPEVRVRPLRDGAGVHELVCANADERSPLTLTLRWQWPEAVDAVLGDAIAVLDAGGEPWVAGRSAPTRELVTRVALAPGARAAIRLRSVPGTDEVELLAPGPRGARSTFGRGEADYAQPTGTARRSVVVPLDFDAARRELTSIAVDDDVASWTLRDRASLAG